MIYYCQYMELKEVVILNNKQRDELTKYAKCKQILANVFKVFLGKDPQDIDNAIDSILEMIGEFVSADRSYVFQMNNQGQTMTNTHEWCATNIKPQIDTLQDISVNTMPWWIKNTVNNESVFVSNVDDLPLDEFEKAQFQRQSIKSFLTIPVYSQGEMLGFIGLDWLKKGKSRLGEEDVSFLETIAEVIAMALKRSEAERIIKESEMRYKALVNEYEIIFDMTQTAMFLVDVNPDGGFRYLRTNSVHQETTGLAKERIWGKTPKEVLSEDLANKVEDNYGKCVSKRTSLTYEETLELPGGNRVWLTTLSPVIEGGSVVQIVGSSQDITNRKMAEEALST